MPHEMINAIYSNSVRPNSHLVGFAKSEPDLSLDKKHSLHWRCLEVGDEYIKISSKYII